MLKITKIALSALFVGSFLASCVEQEETRINPNTPDCVQGRINGIKKEAKSNPAKEVWRYNYNGQTVYYVSAGCCDQASELLDGNCNLICNPDGGLTGRGDGKCTDFHATKKNGVLVWKDDRK